MMSYAQGSSVRTTSTSVPKCRKETPDRFAVCTVERTVAQRLPLTHKRNHQHNRTTTTTTTGSTGGRSRTTWTGPPEPQGQGGGGGGVGRGENRQHSSTTKVEGGTIPTTRGGGGGGWQPWPGFYRDTGKENGNYYIIIGCLLGGSISQ